MIVVEQIITEAAALKFFEPIITIAGSTWCSKSQEDAWQDVDYSPLSCVR